MNEVFFQPSLFHKGVVSGCQGQRIGGWGAANPEASGRVQFLPWSAVTSAPSICLILAQRKNLYSLASSNQFPYRGWPQFLAVGAYSFHPKVTHSILFVNLSGSLSLPVQEKYMSLLFWSLIYPRDFLWPMTNEWKSRVSHQSGASESWWAIFPAPLPLPGELRRSVL